MIHLRIYCMYFVMVRIPKTHGVLVDAIVMIMVSIEYLMVLTSQKIWMPAGYKGHMPSKPGTIVMANIQMVQILPDFLQTILRHRESIAY